MLVSFRFLFSVFSLLQTFCMYLCVSLHYVVFALFDFVLLDLVYSVAPRQEIGREEHLRTGLCCVEWDLKP